MITVALEHAGTRLDDVARRAEGGERVVLTRDGRPIADVVPHVAVPEITAANDQPAPTGGIDFDAVRRFLDERGIKDMFTFVSPDFDDPLPEDFLLRPLP